jgi:hypothetical protein
MRFLQVIVFLAFVIVANGGKVNWDSQGKPQIEKPKKPVKGCMRGGLESLGQDNNTSNCKGER